MAYVCYFACDRCAKEGMVKINHTVSLSTAILIARERKWQVGKKGWICPDCQKRKDNKR